ncbi:MAG: hypothetical protein H6741_03340 [Alphaproteobacteria bacterium]|nr:hypothetical protein [Alphaproteobacteria bacterium]
MISRYAIAALSALALSGCGSDIFVRGNDTPVEEEVFVTETFTQAALPKVDVLWVIDDTGSMGEEQAALADAFPSFVDALEGVGLNYHLGVISTDAGAEDAGLLLGDPWIITPAAEDPAALFAEAAAVGTQGLGPVAGLAATLMALGEPMISEDNRGFRRADAALQVVVVSDDDDRSEDFLDGDPATLALAFLAEEAAATGLPAFLSAVIGDPGVGCNGSRGVALPGDTFAEVAEGSGGVVESICGADFSELVEELGALSVAVERDFPLQTEPYTDALRVSVDGERQDEGWSLLREPALVRFDEAPAAGAVIEVRYQVAPSIVEEAP